MKRLQILPSPLLVALLVVSTVACTRESDEQVLVHYYPFARSPYAPIQFLSAEKVPGAFSFSVDAGNTSIQKVVDHVERFGGGEFDRRDIRLVIRFRNGEFVAVDSKGGVLNKGREGKLPTDRVREIATTLESMPENPYSRVIKE